MSNFELLLSRTDGNSFEELRQNVQGLAQYIETKINKTIDW